MAASGLAVSNNLNGHRLLNNLQVVSLDTETTGLDVAVDRIVSVGACRLHGCRVQDHTALQTLVRPDIPIPPSSTAIHGITDQMVEGAPLLPEVIAELRAYCGDQIIIGHSIGFDLAVLRHESRRHGLAWRERLWLDTGLLAVALNPVLGNAGLESVADWLGVEINGRHTADGDARTAAELYIRLLPRLRDAGVRTLGEALRFQQTASAALAMQQAAGWFDGVDAGGAVTSTAAPSIVAFERIDSYPYRHRVNEVMLAQPLFVEPTASLVEVARAMFNARSTAAFIGTEADIEALGILTQGDVLHAVATGGEQALAKPASAIAMRPVVCLGERAYVYQALGRMERFSIGHLGVTAADGRIVGLLSSRELVRGRAANAIRVGDRIMAADSATELAAAADDLPALAEGLLAEGMNAAAISAVVSDVLRHITARAAALAERDLIASGAGAAPVPWALLVLGSGGRGESLLAPDQDNAIVYLGSPQHDPWFASFAGRLVDILDEAGIPYCKGEVMANNPQWRKNLTGWREEIESWVTLADGASFRQINAFFDMESVHGEARIAAELRQLAVEAATAHSQTLERLAQALTKLRPPIGLFGRIDIRDGRVDLKTAILPLVTAARILTLVCGSTAHTTADRWREASAGTLLAATDAEVLIRTHHLLLELVLKQQLIDMHEGIPASYRVDISRLDQPTTRRLKEALKHLDNIVAYLPEYCVRR
jgi:CBS domain-containing protein